MTWPASSLELEEFMLDVVACRAGVDSEVDVASSAFWLEFEDVMSDSVACAGGGSSNLGMTTLGLGLGLGGVMLDVVNASCART